MYCRKGSLFMYNDVEAATYPKKNLVLHTSRSKRGLVNNVIRKGGLGGGGTISTPKALSLHYAGWRRAPGHWRWDSLLSWLPNFGTSRMAKLASRRNSPRPGRCTITSSTDSLVMGICQVEEK